MVPTPRSLAVGRRIRRLRTEGGLSQDALARLAGTHQPTVANWENGIHVPTYDRAVPLAAVLGITVEALLSGEDS